MELPKSISPDERDFDEEKGEIGGYGSSASGQAPQVRFSVAQRITHPGEVNKARYMPQNPNLIATMCADGRTLVWDRTKHSIQPTSTTPKPQIELHGHKKEGYGLCWNPHEQGHLATGSEDGTVRLW